jgi:hypothetical protein
MRRHTDTLAAAAIIVVFAATLAPPPAIGECLAGPIGDPLPGSRWYYQADRQRERKCWYLGKAVRNGAAPHRGGRNWYLGKAVRNGAAPHRGGRHAAAEIVDHGHPATQPAAAPAPVPAPPPTGEVSSRECDIEQSVLNYRKVLATVFQTDVTNTEVDAQVKELAAKGCQNK